MNNAFKSKKTPCLTTGCGFSSPRDKDGRSLGSYCKGCRVMRKRAKIAGFNPDEMTWSELNNKFWDTKEKE